MREPRLQDHKNRQSSIEVDDQLLIKRWEQKQEQVIDLVKQTYQWAIEHGIAKEQARCILPEGNTVSRLYVQGTIRSFIHYIEVRTDPSTQKEHRELAFAVSEAISQVFDYQNRGK